jgi:very-short-patch-repair endonuclease
MRNIDARIGISASSTAGAVRTCALYEQGISRDSVHRRLAEGTLTRWHGDVLLLAHVAPAPPLETRLHAAVLAGHERAVLSHDTAVTRFGAWDRWDGTIHVTSRSVRERPWPDGVIFHRDRAGLPDEALSNVDGVPTMSAPWAAALLGTTLTEHQVASVLRELRFRGHLDIDEFEEFIGDLGRPRGLHVVRSAIALVRAGSAGTRSTSEDRLHCGFRAARLPEPLVNVRGATGHPGIELDFVWPDHRVVVECDGRQHRFDDASRGDDALDDLLRGDGWLPIRLPATWIWDDLRRCVRLVSDALGRRVPRTSRQRVNLGIRS